MFLIELFILFLLHRFLFPYLQPLACTQRIIRRYSLVKAGIAVGVKKILIKSYSFTAGIKSTDLNEAESSLTGKSSSKNKNKYLSKSAPVSSASASSASKQQELRASLLADNTDERNILIMIPTLFPPSLQYHRQHQAYHLVIMIMMIMMRINHLIIITIIIMKMLLFHPLIIVLIVAQ